MARVEVRDWRKNFVNRAAFRFQTGFCSRAASLSRPVSILLGRAFSFFLSDPVSFFLSRAAYVFSKVAPPKLFLKSLRLSVFLSRSTWVFP